jgi:hypothetical protein
MGAQEANSRPNLTTVNIRSLLDFSAIGLAKALRLRPQAVAKMKTVPVDSNGIITARALEISFGD